jgi:[ribosomal protein S5]-alanine N-acetyltransferase
MVPLLETSRLLVRPLKACRSPANAERWFPHGEVVKFLADRVPWPYPSDLAFKHSRDEALPAMARGERRTWSLRLKSATGRGWVRFRL